MKIGIDIMGGDFAPKKTIEGQFYALEHFQAKDRNCFYLVLKKKFLRS